MADGEKIDRLVEQQQEAFNSIADFVSEAAEATLKGEFKPSELAVKYAALLKTLGGRFAAITKIVLS